MMYGLKTMVQKILQPPLCTLIIRTITEHMLPIWMATRTLALARGNDAMFLPGVPVKIARPEVEALIAECLAFAANDDALRTRYARLHQRDTDVASA